MHIYYLLNLAQVIQKVVFGSITPVFSMKYVHQPRAKVERI